jgi:hypothetical protein
MFYAANNNVICKPHPLSGGLKAEVKSGVAFVKQKQDIIELEVLQNSSILEGQQSIPIPKGSIVYVREERLTTLSWGKQVQKLKGEDVILIPGSEIVGIEFQEPEDDREYQAQAQGEE